MFLSLALASSLSNLVSFGIYRNISDVLWEAISSGKVLSLYQGLGTKNLQSFISQFVYFYGYNYFKRLYLEKSGAKSIGTKANLVVAAAAGACTAILTQVSISVSLPLLEDIPHNCNWLFLIGFYYELGTILAHQIVLRCVKL